MSKPYLILLGVFALVSCNGSDEGSKEAPASNDAPRAPTSQVRSGPKGKEISKGVYLNAAPSAEQRKGAEEIDAAMSAVSGKDRMTVMRLVSCRAREKLIPTDWSMRAEAIRKAASDVAAGLPADDKCGRQIASPMGGMMGNAPKPAK